MSLINKRFNSKYDSYIDDVIADFYNEALSEAIQYDRVSAYFDSKILALYSTGLENLYKENGKIRFIFSQELDEDDYNLMKEGYEARYNNILESNFKEDELDEDDIVKISNLAFLIEKNIVDIKIAFTKSGILHDKYGLIYDSDGNSIYFRGSNNETIASVEKNHERFEVSCSWYNEANENKKIVDASESFELMWNDEFQGMRIIDLPDVIKSKIIHYSQGKIVLEEYNYNNALVADIVKGRLQIKDNLDISIDFDKDFDYKNFIKKYVEFVENKTYYFYDGINYVIMEKILDRYKRCAQYNNFNLIITPRLSRFITRKSIQIEKRKELGKMIKERDYRVKNYYDNFKKIVDSEMKRSLRDKQMWDSFFICKMIKSANYSVPGAGKTSIVYGAFAYLNSSYINEVDKIIVVCPKNAFKSWKDEFFECFGHKKELKMINVQDTLYKDAATRKKALRFDSRNKNLILINYDMLNSVKDVLEEIIDQRVMLVFDEVHKVKKINGFWAQNSLKISKNAKYKVVMTGTPIPNSYADLYNQLNILFTDEYRTFFKFTASELENANPIDAEKINKSIYPFFCRTTKKDLAIPAPNKDECVRVNMTSKEQILFDFIWKKYRHNGLLLYIRLLQASTNPRLLLSDIDMSFIDDLFNDEEQEENDIIVTNVKEESTLESSEIQLINQLDMTSKFWTGIDLVEKLVKEDKKVLVWAIFVRTIDRIEVELEKRGIRCKKIYGSTDLESREQIIDQFKNNEFDVLIANPHTLAESVSLHKTCHDAVYFEYSFNLTHMLQSRDRINRLGLPDNQYTQYYYLVLEGSGLADAIDQRTYDRLKEKEERMLKSIEGELIEAINFDIWDDIKEILNEN